LSALLGCRYTSGYRLLCVLRLIKLKFEVTKNSKIGDESITVVFYLLRELDPSGLKLFDCFFDVVAVEGDVGGTGWRVAILVSRDTRARFVAYVPPGSIKKGQTLASTGGGGHTQQCATCHGPDLKGLGPIPGIAGRSPSYIVRQLYDFKHGTRAGVGSALMKASVEKLSVDDMIALAAYAGSLAP
jgi:cytochrome c553